MHRLLTREDLVGKLLRRLERTLLKRSRALVVSSPGFLKNHFNRHYDGDFRAFLVENRLCADSDFGPRPMAESAVEMEADGKLVLGWISVSKMKNNFCF